VAKRKPAAKQSGNGRAGQSGRKPGAGPASSRSGKPVARPGAGGKTSAAAKPAARKATKVRPAVEKKTPVSKPKSNHRLVETKPLARNSRSLDGVSARADGKGLSAPNSAEDAGDMLTQTNLTEAELEEFRGLLLEKRHELVGDVNNLSDEARRAGALDGTASSMPIHMADLGSDTWEQELTLGLIENERGLLREIDEALDRIDKKTYGICIATNKPIGKARLRLKPWAKYCIEYARKRELGLA
jgi:DnaK suppressor protein